MNKQFDKHLRCVVNVSQLRVAARLARALPAFSTPAKPSAAVPGNVKLEILDQDLILAATTPDADVRTRVRATSSRAGVTVVPARDLIAALARAKGDAQIEADGASLVVHTNAGRHVLMTLPSDKLRALPESTQLIATVSGADLARMVRRVAYAQSTDVTRKSLFGTLIERTNNELRMVATDGFRAAIARTANRGPRFEEFVHRAGIAALAQIELAEEPAVLIGLGHTQIHFNSRNADVSCRMINFAFPQWRRAIPGAPVGSITFNRKAILGVLSAIDPGTIFGGVRLYIDTARRTVHASTDEGEAHKIKLEAMLSGRLPARIGLNRQYVIDALASLDDEVVRLDFAAEKASIQIEASDGTIALLMPLGD